MNETYDINSFDYCLNLIRNFDSEQTYAFFTSNYMIVGQIEKDYLPCIEGEFHKFARQFDTKNTIKFDNKNHLFLKNVTVTNIQSSSIFQSEFFVLFKNDVLGIAPSYSMPQ